MAQRLGLRETWKSDRVLSLMRAKPRRDKRRFVDIHPSRVESTFLENQRLLHIEDAIASEGFRRVRDEFAGIGRTTLRVQHSL